MKTFKAKNKVVQSRKKRNGFHIEVLFVDEQLVVNKKIVKII